jgi:hypothetical protein
MRIYKIAQTSSIMYYINSSPDEVLLTPDPTVAKRSKKDNEETVSAFILPTGKYFNPSKRMSFSDVILRRLKNKGYMGAIDGDYMHMFEAKALKLLGRYNFISQTINK